MPVFPKDTRFVIVSSTHTIKLMEMVNDWLSKNDVTLLEWKIYSSNYEKPNEYGTNPNDKDIMGIRWCLVLVYCKSVGDKNGKCIGNFTDNK